MSGTGKHQEVKSKQNLDGTFEFIVEDSEASETSEAEVEEPATGPKAGPRSSRMIMFAVLGAVFVLGALVLVYTMESNDITGGESDVESAGFRPYKASGSNVEVPANAPSNEIPVESETEQEADESAEVVEPAAEPEVEILEEAEEEFVEADEVIGDGEILDGSEEEMLESAQSETLEGLGNTVKPSIRPENLDMERITESVRSQIVNGVNPRQLQGIRNLSPAQLRQLQQNVQKENSQEYEAVEEEVVEEEVIE